MPGVSVTTLTLTVQLGVPAARSPPDTTIDVAPAPACTAKADPVTFTQVPPTAGVGATTRPVGRLSVKPQSFLAASSAVLVMVNVSVVGVPVVPTSVAKALSRLGVASTMRRLSKAKSLPVEAEIWLLMRMRAWAACAGVRRTAVSVKNRPARTEVSEPNPPLSVGDVYRPPFTLQATIGEAVSGWTIAPMSIEMSRRELLFTPPVRTEHESSATSTEAA